MVTIDSQWNWLQFNEEMNKNLTDFDVSSRPPRFSYVDEDGDKIYFESDMELKEALNFAVEELFIIFVEAAEKDEPKICPPIPQPVPSAIPQEGPQQQYGELVEVVNAIGKAIPQIATVFENILDKDNLQTTITSAAKLFSEFCDEKEVKDGIEKFVEDFAKQSKQPEEPEKKIEKIVHNAICDYCSRHIEGFRYKCLKCDDYDLCETCEALNIKNKFHDESHVFAKIIKPASGPSADDLSKYRSACEQQEQRALQLLEEKLKLRARFLERSNENNNNFPSPIPESNPVVPEVVAVQPLQQEEHHQSDVDLLTEEERQCFEKLKAMGFDIHASIVSENNGDLAQILEKIV